MNDKSLQAPYTPWALGLFARVDAVNPLFDPQESSMFSCPLFGPVRWEDEGIFNPAAVVRGGHVYCLYRATGSIEGRGGMSRIGLAWSEDGLHFERHPYPVLSPGEGALKDLGLFSGIQDPRVVEAEDGGYVMWGNYATYWLNDPLTGIRRSTTPQYLRILHDFVTALPYWEMEPTNEAAT